MGAHSPLADHRPVILFDGVCNLCNSSVQFIIRNDPDKKFAFASLQSSVAKDLLTELSSGPTDLYSILLLKNGKVFDRSDAILEISKDLSRPWSAIYVFRFLPKAIRDALYKLIANNRYKLFGRQDSCLMPTPELRARFID